MIHANQFLVLLLAATATVANGDVIATTTVTLGGGIFSYDYTLHNSGSDGVFSFSMDVSGSILTVIGPTGWLESSTPVLGDVLIDWESIDPSFDVLPISSLSGFEVTSLLPPGTVQFSALDESLNEFTGSTQGPVASTSAVPEPNSVVVIGAVIVFLTVVRWRKRRECP